MPGHTARHGHLTAGAGRSIGARLFVERPFVERSFAARHIVARHRAGNSLAEMMVGLAVGMIVMALVLKVGVLFDARRKSVSGMSAANIDGTLAMLSLVRELRMAGNGLGPPDALRCDLTRAAGVTLGPVMPLQPLIIVNGAAGASDSIELLSSGKPQSLPAARLVAAFAPGSASLTVDSTFGVAPGDWLMLQQAGTTRCLLLQVEHVPIGAYRIEPAALPNLALPAGGYGAGSALVNLGSVHRWRYAIGADATLQQSQFDIASGHWSSSAVASDIVNLQAQYGFDARPGTQPVPAVTWWSDDLVDADGNGTVGNAGDWQRMLAVRIAIVLRSAQRKEGPCDTTAPVWRAGDSVTGQLGPVTLFIGTAATARCYRYRVIEAEVPLRNALWSDA